MMLDVFDAALASMVRGPRPLIRALDFSAEEFAGGEGQFNPKDLLNHLQNAGSGDEILGLLRRRLAFWDNERAEWAGSAERNSDERRSLIYQKLALDDEWITLCQTRLPYQPLARPTVIATEHRRWYSAEIRSARDFYWSRYTKQLAKQGWPEESILQLDESTTSVVERLSDPTSDEAWQSKGLVIGYVQSGKTANFTGVIAKAADAGYKLIIVLGGMLDVLRSQTQRRIDKELIGRELLGREYINDPDWDDFLSHGAKPSELGTFDWSRLTGPEEDYQRLAYGVEALKFEAQNSALPFFHPDNLLRAGARIAVVKKNSKVIQKLLTDLNALSRRRLGAPLDQVPTLIIDDESDQGSINVKKQSALALEEERTATNKAIVDLLKLLPRAQYVGYTATPFANVFVDPDSEADIFPKDFLVSLPRPAGYMGVADFYDLDSSTEEDGPNKRDFVRSVKGEDDEPENLQKAIDSFVLSGALKLWRGYQDPRLKFRHHTMLIHLSQLVQDHKSQATLVRKIYAVSGYDGGDGIDRLDELFETDFRPVFESRGENLPFPDAFDELEPYIGECLQRIGEAADAVLVVNNENKDQTPDFDKQSVWKILVGGAKLSRGYTVEGLTISYYRRRAGAADTLMQMGRWFGFRRGYGDLVRLFIGTEEKTGAKSKKTINLYEAFGAICRDEELFRYELERYASMDEPRVTPGQIPPLVPQHMLRPTAANKMRNAVVEYRNFGGSLAESTFAPTEPDHIRHNNDALAAMVSDRAAKLKRLAAVINKAEKVLPAWIIPFTTPELLTFLRAYRWYDPRSKDAKLGNPLRLQLEFLEGKAGNTGIKDWILLGPKINKPRAQKLLADADFDVVYRSRHDEQVHRFHTYNDPVHRAFARHICGQITLTDANNELDDLRCSGRGVMIYYPVTDIERDKSNKPAKPPFTVGFTLLFPNNQISTPLSFSVRRKGLPDEAIVPVDE